MPLTVLAIFKLSTFETHEIKKGILSTKSLCIIRMLGNNNFTFSTLNNKKKAIIPDKKLPIDCKKATHT